MALAPRTTRIRTPVSPSTRTVKSTSTNSLPLPRPPLFGPPALPSQTLPEKPSLLCCKRPMPQARLSAMVLASSRTSPSSIPLPPTAPTALRHPSMPPLPVRISVPLLPTVWPLLPLLSPRTSAPATAATRTTSTHSPPLSIPPPPSPRSLKAAAHLRTSTPRASASSPLPFFAALCYFKLAPSRASVQFSSYSPYHTNFIGPPVRMNVRHNLRSDFLSSCLV